MRYPWVNTTLFVLLTFQLLTGFLGLTNGSESLQWVLWLHGIGGYAIVAILSWKALVILDAFRRSRRLTIARGSFLLLAGLLLFILATGLTWVFGGRIILFGLSLMTWHALASLALVGLFIWHVLAHAYIVRMPSSRDRRAFLRSTVTVAAGFFAWRLVEPALAILRLPGAARRFTGSYEIGSLSGDFPQVIWLSDSVQPIDPSRWQLEVSGKVEKQLALGHADLARLATDRVIETLDCTGGWYSIQEWSGVNLDRVLEMARIKPDAQSIVVQAVSGYARRFDLTAARGFMLALGVAGRALTHGHGAPVRLIAPNYRGYDWVKWVVSVRVDAVPAYLQSPLPLQ